MNKISKQFSSIEQITDQYLKKGSQGTAALDGELSFGEILKQKQSVDESSALKFSKHASMRLQSRNIELSTEQKERLETGAEKAEAKGMKESLVIVDSYSFIVNVPNKTVVTAMDHTESGENVYTNIDGAVII
ncbi:MAG: flagellar protein [Lachnospiraceae bacterium]|mgnify:CR=1 FL=1|jgi:flagellar operon protein|nr:flagellar protein [Lachnospiraceae bacterium]